MKIFGAAVIGLLVGLAAGSASAQSVQLRSGLPLWNNDHGVDETYPKNFIEDDGFGCSSNLNFGDYRALRPDGEPDVFWRISNYGVFHCALILRQASDRENLAEARFEYMWIIPLGEVTRDGQRRELLAFQIGIAGGSEYLLLSRPKGSLQGPFELLEPTCPRGAEFREASLDIWHTAYCVVESQGALKRIAFAAARRSIAGTLEWVGDEASPPTPPAD